MEIGVLFLTDYSFGGFTLNLTLWRVDFETMRLWLLRRRRLSRASGESWEAKVMARPTAIKPIINQTNQSPRMMQWF
jgi:hypothetical protein